VNPLLVHRSPPRGDERVQFDLLLLGQGAPVPKIEELREAAAQLRSEDVVPFHGVIRIGCVPGAKGNGIGGEDVVQPDVQHGRDCRGDFQVWTSDAVGPRQPIERPCVHRQPEACGDPVLEIGHSQIPRTEQCAEPRVDRDTH
jgi:hypothetical protein